MTPLELAWAAGFVDGEGHITVTKKHERWSPPRSKHTGRPRHDGTHYQLLLDVCNRNPAPIDKLVELFGGERKGSRRKGYKANYYTWRVFGNQAQHALELMLPFFVGKRVLAETCVSFQAWYSSTQPAVGLTMSGERRAQAEIYHQTCQALIRQFRSAPGEGKVLSLAVVNE